MTKELFNRVLAAKAQPANYLLPLAGSTILWLDINRYDEGGG